MDHSVIVRIALLQCSYGFCNVRFIKNHTKFVWQVFGVNIQYMQNFTITLEESALAWAEIEAKRCNCSVAMLLGQLLKEKMLSEVAEKQPPTYAIPTK